jgi:hypothetical protein
MEQAHEECESKRLGSPPYSLDLLPCDFYLFGYLRQKMKLLSYEALKELE